MAESGANEELDRAIEEMMAEPDRPSPKLGPRLAALLRTAVDLRDLPREEFKARLHEELLSEAAGAIHGNVLVGEDDIRVRLEELATQPKLVAHDLATALRDLPEMSMRFLASLNQSTLGVSRFSTQIPLWERHPAGDELIHVLEGELDMTTLTADGPVRTRVQAGSLFLCRRGLWHWPRPVSPTTILFATPGEGTESSRQTDPRAPAAGGVDLGATSADPTIVAHDLAAALDGLPELVITDATTGDEADAAVRTIAKFGPCMLGVMRYSGLTPWERHPDGDELLHVLEGEADVIVMTDTGPTEVAVRAGSVFVCPRGLWHRQRPRPSVTMLFGTPSETSEVSFADDPRTPAGANPRKETSR